MDEPDIRRCFDGDQWSGVAIGAWLVSLFDRAVRLGFSACVVTATLAATLAASASAQRKLIEVSSDTDSYRALHNAALGFVEAIRRRDELRLVDLALPEDRDRVRTDLRNRGSRLSQILFERSRAVRTRINAIRIPRVILLQHPDLIDAGNGTTVCVVDSQSRFDVPRTIGDVAALDSGKEVCVFFFVADGRWFLSYDFAYPD